MLVALGSRTSALCTQSLSRTVLWTGVRYCRSTTSRTRVGRLLSVDAPLEQPHVHGQTANETPTVKSSFLKTLVERGFYHQCTNVDGLDDKLCTGEVVKGYLGFDATADRCISACFLLLTGNFVQ